MNQELQTISKNSLTKSMNELIPVTANNTSIIQILTDSSEPSLVKIKKEYGQRVSRTLLIMQVGKMLEITGAELNKAQTEFIADHIEKNYWGYKLSDLNVITTRIATSKSYGKPTIQSICKAIEDYSYERDENAVMIKARENSKHKEDLITNDRMYKIYEQMKEDAKKPQPTLLEKRTENLRVHREKMEEIEELYPEKEWKKYLTPDE